MLMVNTNLTRLNTNGARQCASVYKQGVLELVSKLIPNIVKLIKLWV